MPSYVACVEVVLARSRERGELFDIWKLKEVTEALRNNKSFSLMAGGTLLDIKPEEMMELMMKVCDQGTFHHKMQGSLEADTTIDKAFNRRAMTRIANAILMYINDVEITEIDSFLKTGTFPLGYESGHVVVQLLDSSGKKVDDPEGEALPPNWSYSNMKSSYFLYIHEGTNKLVLVYKDSESGALPLLPTDDYYLPALKMLANNGGVLAQGMAELSKLFHYNETLMENLCGQNHQEGGALVVTSTPARMSWPSLGVQNAGANIMRCDIVQALLEARGIELQSRAQESAMSECVRSDERLDTIKLNLKFQQEERDRHDEQVKDQCEEIQELTDQLHETKIELAKVQSERGLSALHCQLRKERKEHDKQLKELIEKYEKQQKELIEKYEKQQKELIEKYEKQQKELKENFESRFERLAVKLLTEVAKEGEKTRAEFRASTADHKRSPREHACTTRKL